MSERDYNKQGVKRQRIRSTTLVVGIDVGKAYNAVGFINKEGKVLGNCAKVYNSREGFEQFTKMVEDWNRQGITGGSLPILQKSRVIRFGLSGRRLLSTTESWMRAPQRSATQEMQ